MTPFEAVFGRSPPTLSDYLAGSSTIATVDDLLTERAKVLTTLRVNLQRAQHRMRNQANSKRTDVEFQPGEWVLLKLQPYRQSSLARRTNHKLSMRFFGPFEIEERIGAVAYRLKLPLTAKLHNVFHVSRLKLFKGDPAQLFHPLPESFIAQHPLRTPQTILKYREVLQGSKAYSQALVQWEGQPDSDATWEDVVAFKNTFPDFTLEDKCVAKTGAIDADATCSGNRRTGRKNKGISSTKYDDFLLDWLYWRMESIVISLMDD